MEAEGASDEAIKAIRMTPEQKQQRLNEFAVKKSGIQEEVSVNADVRVDTGALLTGDSSEELRMQPRLIEKAENAK